jgi:hypothetical protein
MDRVTEDRTLRNPYVLHFTDTRLKPFPMNVTNRRIIVAAYGDDDSAWVGRQIELYFNPSIPNPRNPNQPGGICVRVSIGNGPRPSAAPESSSLAAPTTSPRPTTGAPNDSAPAPKAAPQPLAAEKAQALDGIRRADTRDNLDRWQRWAASLPFDDLDRAELSRATAAAVERLGMARRSAPAGC